MELPKIGLIIRNTIVCCLPLGVSFIIASFYIAKIVLKKPIRKTKKTKIVEILTLPFTDNLSVNRCVKQDKKRLQRIENQIKYVSSTTVTEVSKHNKFSTRTRTHIKWQTLYCFTFQVDDK